MSSMALKKSIGQSQVFDVNLDMTVFLTAGLLLTLGIVMVASSSVEVSNQLYGDPFHLTIRHLVYVSIALIAGLITLMVPLSVWQRFDRVLLILSFVLLGLVLVPGIGREVNGSMRWISLGTFSVQPSELVKLFSLVFMAAYLVREEQNLQQRMGPLLVAFLPMAGLTLLLLMEPDYGAAVVIMATVMGVTFLARVPFRYFSPLLLASLLAATLLAVMQSYRVERMIAFLNPWDHQFSSGYQLTQALIAIGRGEWFGLGLGNSIQKQFFLPEAHTDFVFSITAEELGGVGALLIIGLFAFLGARGFTIGSLAEKLDNKFGALMAYGATLLLWIQASINIGVNIGMLPTKGLTLPFISYGGNSLILSCMLVAVILRVDFENHQQSGGSGSVR